MQTEDGIARLQPGARDRGMPDPGADTLIEQARERLSHPLAGSERRASLLSGCAFFAAALGLALIPSSQRSPSPVTVILLLAAFAVASQVEFEVGAGVAIPTELILVPMLFLVPPGTVPLLVAAGFLLGHLLAHYRRGVHLARIAVIPGNSWHAVGPALVLVLAGPRAPDWSDWPIYLAALAAQFVVDYASSASREWIAFGVPPGAQLRFMGWVWLVDAGLAPIGLLAAFSATGEPAVVLLVVPLIALLAVFARQRSQGIDRVNELGNAYRGTAFLLSDVLEADDAYTGFHSRDVVTLVLAVTDELGVDDHSQGDAELAALLHDVGKIRIPTEILNKPGALTSEERALMETHTAEGERMLARVGGLLGDVGRIVRSSHERFDGSGYPDGLAGEQIPFIARIVACCDAYSAMTTDRPYRGALPIEHALAELRGEAGAQFDPVVVQALVAVVERARGIRREVVTPAGFAPALRP
ncbi:MAG TPA: HD-GYP domain-containing protein [Gaiellaceae bacterium]